MRTVTSSRLVIRCMVLVANCMHMVLVCIYVIQVVPYTCVVLHEHVLQFVKINVTVGETPILFVTINWSVCKDNIYLLFLPKEFIYNVCFSVSQLLLVSNNYVLDSDIQCIEL